MAHLVHAGNDAELPKEKDLLGTGVCTFKTAESHIQEQLAKEQSSNLLSTLEGGEENGDGTPHTPLLLMGAGLLATPKKLVTKICRMSTLILRTLSQPKDLKAGLWRSPWKGR